MNEREAFRLQERCGDWHRARFPNATLGNVVHKLCEETGEVSGAFLGLDGTEHPERAGNFVNELRQVALICFTIADRYAGCDLLAQVQLELNELNGTREGMTSPRLPEVRQGSSLHTAGCPRSNPDPTLPDSVHCTCRRTS